MKKGNKYKLTTRTFILRVHASAMSHTILNYNTWNLIFFTTGEQCFREYISTLHAFEFFRYVYPKSKKKISSQQIIMYQIALTCTFCTSINIDIPAFSYICLNDLSHQDKLVTNQGICIAFVY